MKHYTTNSAKLFVFLSAIASILLLSFSTRSQAATGNWESLVTGGNIVYTSTESNLPLKDANGKYVTVVYLENMGFDKLGENTNETDVAWLLSKGYRVIELDYANDTNAVSPKINKDIIAINDAISNGSFCGYSDCSTNQSYVLFEGYRISRNVPYFFDDPTVYGYLTKRDSLYMDIIYPANAAEKVPVVLSFSYSNSYAGNIHQRLFLGYTLAMFDDSFLEGAPASNIAWAIADHPKYAPWGYGDTKSFEVNPDAAQKVKSAVRTLRVLGEDLGLSGKIGIYGFSRGSSAGSMAVGDRSDSIVENAGLNIGISDNVQAAALGSGVFDFTQIYNDTDDGDSNLENLCPDLWGALETNYDLWYSMGAAYFVESSKSAPVLFFYNTDDSPHYLDQINHFKAKLDELSVPTSTLIDYGSNHSVPQTDASLSELYTFFNYYLNLKDSIPTGIGALNTEKIKNENVIPLDLLPNPASNEMQIKMTLAKTDKVQIVISGISGNILFKTEKEYKHAGLQSETIYLQELALPQGIYFVKVLAGNRQGMKKFIKIN